jgi:hypothetical protein
MCRVVVFFQKANVRFDVDFQKVDFHSEDSYNVELESGLRSKETGIGLRKTF